MKDDVVAMVLGPGGNWEVLQQIGMFNGVESIRAMRSPYLCARCFASGNAVGYRFDEKNRLWADFECSRCGHKWERED